MIQFRQKEYTSLGLKTSVKSQKAILGAADKFFKSKAGKVYLKAIGSKQYKEAAKGVEAVGKTIKEVGNNPGHAVRRATAGTVINPGMTAATIGDPVLAAAVPAYNLSPVNLKMVAAANPNLTRTPEPVRRIGREMMRNNNTPASRFGRSIEHGVNRAALNSQSILSGIAI